MEQITFTRIQKSYFHRNLKSAIFQTEYLKHESRNLFLGILNYEDQNYAKALFHLKKQKTKTSIYYEVLCYKATKNYQKAVENLYIICENKGNLKDITTDTFFDLFIISDDEYIHELHGDCLSHCNEREQAINSYSNAYNIYPLYNSVLNLIMEGKTLKTKINIENEFITDLTLFSKNRDSNLLNKYKQYVPGIGSYFIGECARMYIDDGEFELASILFETIKKLDPFNFSYSHFYSTLLWYKKDTEKLALLCKTLVEYTPNSYILWIALGNYFSLKFDHTRAITCFKRSIFMNRNYYSLLLLGHEYILKQEYTLAQKFFTQSIKYYKNNYNAFFSVGIVHASTGKVEHAVNFFLKGIKINKRNVKLKVLLMELYNRNKETNKAMQLFLEIFKMETLDLKLLVKYINSNNLDLNRELALLELVDYLILEGYEDKCEEIMEAVSYRGRVYQNKKELLYGKVN